MITENLSTLKIHKLTQEQYDRELAAGRIDETALYLTPDEEIDLSGYATVDDLKVKADTVHAHDDLYYTEDEIEEKISTINISINAKVNTADIIDNITTENASLPLSANQGVVLQGNITEVANAVKANTDAIAGITAIPDSEIIALFSS